MKKKRIMKKTKKTSKKLKSNCKSQSERQIFLHRLQQAVEEFCSKNNNLDDPDCELLYARTMEHSFSKRDPKPFQNDYNENPRDNYMCYRCKHFLEIPHNLSQLFCNKMAITFAKQYKIELSFVQAIVWLKFFFACGSSQISVERLQQIFNEQWNRHDKCNYYKDKHSDDDHVEKLIPVIKNLSMRNNFRTSTPININISHLDTFQKEILHARAENMQSNLLEPVLTNSMNESFVEMTLMLEDDSSSCITADKKGTEILESSINLDSEKNSFRGFDLISKENFDMDDRIPEHQCFEFEENVYDSVQTASKNIDQISQEVDEEEEEKDIFLTQKNTNVLSKHESTLSIGNKFITPMSVTSEYNFEEECFTPLGNRSNFQPDKTSKFDDSLKSYNITQKNITQMSDLSTNFEFLLDNNNSWEKSLDNIITEDSKKDSAYSTLHMDMEFKTDNKRTLNTECYYESQSCQKDIIYMGENKSTEPQNNKNLRETSDTIFENPKDDVPAKFIIGNKHTSNIEHSSKQQSYRLTITCEKTVASPSIIQGVEISDTKRYNLRPRIKKSYSSLFTTKRRKESKSEVLNQEKKEKKEHEDEMIPSNWWSLTLESLHMERMVLASIQVIISTLCDKKTTKKYTIRDYWKDSLEEQAVNAVLNISDIFTIEKKPNICVKEIVMTIIKVLDEMMMDVQLNKIYYSQTFVWIYRIQIMLEFCNSLPVCVKIIDHLITKLKLLQSKLIAIKEILQRNTCVLINQLYLAFYSLNITLRKYRAIIPSDQRSRPAERSICHVADLWKIHYIEKELDHADLNLNVAEKRWLNALENSAVVFTEHFFVSFAEKSFSLIRVLISQSSTRIT